MVDTRTAGKAEAAFRKQEQIREGEKAMAEYRAARAAEDRKTERLRALRLAKQAAEPPAEIKAAKGRPRSRASR